MNKDGTPENLVPSHPGNTNAVRHGVHSPRIIEARAQEIEADLVQSVDFSPVERLALHEVAKCIAILDAIDRELDDRGLLDKTGKPRYLLDHRYRVSRQLDQWLTRVSEAIERQSAAELTPPQADYADYVRELQRIALGHDTTASARDRLSALRELLKLGERGSTSYLEGDWKEVKEMQERVRAVNQAEWKSNVAQKEKRLGIRPPLKLL